jgi:Negative regulator of sigma F
LNDLSFLKDIPDPVAAEASGSEASERLRRTLPTAPTRSTAQRRRTAALGVSLAWLVCHLVAFGVRQDMSQLPAGYIAAQVGLPILFGASCLVVALAPGRLGLGIGVGIVGTMAVLGPLSFWLLAVGMPVPHAPGSSPFGFWLGSLLCLDITLSWAAAPLLLLALSSRRAFPAHAAGRSALLGAALGLLSGGAINLHCSNVEPWHMAAGHGVPVLIAALLGAFLVVRWTRA